MPAGALRWSPTVFCHAGIQECAPHAVSVWVRIHAWADRRMAKVYAAVKPFLEGCRVEVCTKANSGICKQTKHKFEKVCQSSPMVAQPVAQPLTQSCPQGCLLERCGLCARVAMHAAQGEVRFVAPMGDKKKIFLSPAAAAELLPPAMEACPSWQPTDVQVGGRARILFCRSFCSQSVFTDALKPPLTRSSDDAGGFSQNAQQITAEKVQPN